MVFLTSLEAGRPQSELVLGGFFLHYCKAGPRAARVERVSVPVSHLIMAGTGDEGVTPMKYTEAPASQRFCTDG